MLQEIITYMIIGSAATLAILKITKRLAPKKTRSVKKTGAPLAKHEHNCAECAADCQLRDLPKYVIQKNIEQCVPIEQKSKLLQS